MALEVSYLKQLQLQLCSYNVNIKMETFLFVHSFTGGKTEFVIAEQNHFLEINSLNFFHPVIVII